MTEQYYERVARMQKLVKDMAKKGCFFPEFIAITAQNQTQLSKKSALKYIESMVSIGDFEVDNMEHLIFINHEN